MGKPKHSDDPRGEQKGAQRHAEGQHGPKAYAARKDEINDHHREADGDPGPRAARDPRHADGSDGHLHERKIEHPSHERDGGHRLFENRIQHDHAERNSEKNRRTIDVERHGHDREAFQVRGGNESHPAVPPDRAADVKSTGRGGGNRTDEDRSTTS